MPEINHKDQPSIPTPAVAATPAPKVADALSAVTTSDLEKAVAALIEKRHKEAAAAAAPKEPDWANITEAQAMNVATYIPVIEHDIPDYMNIKLKDTEYEAVWASRDQRRLGQLLAEGYEFITPDMMAANFKVPLLFDSDGHYVYADVIAMRAHKRIIFGKRRRALEVSQRQLGNTNRVPKVKSKLEEDGDFEVSIASGMDVYDTR
jgi:hypothetical protein